ncbi:hypothetical protein M3906_000286 [Vibrio metschnikovii]|nr:hypothetical protein [Vibrio metschnikovii]
MNNVERNPSDYLSAMSFIFLVLSMCGVYFWFFTSADELSAQHIILSVIFCVSVLLIHSVLRCLVYITRKQAELGEKELPSEAKES